MSILNREITLADIVSVREEDTREDIATEMLLENEPLEKIIRYTKLTEEKILELKKELKI
jgi:hypothetical protein